MEAWTTIAAGLIGATPPTVLGMWSANVAARQAQDQRKHDSEQRHMDREHERDRDRREHRAHRYHTVNEAIGEVHYATKRLLGAIVSAGDGDRSAETAAAHDDWFEKHVALRAAAIASGDQELASFTSWDGQMEMHDTFKEWRDKGGAADHFAKAAFSVQDGMRSRLVVLFAEV